MVSRRRAREAALQALYQCDTLGEWTAQAVDLYFEVFYGRPSCPTAAQNQNHHNHNGQENYEFARVLMTGVLAHIDFVDRQISAASTNWSITRMARVDRNILRVACFEMAFLADIPLNVSINEAIEIAKNYGSEDSPMFVNGVLDNIAKAFAGNPGLTPAGPERQRRKSAA